MLLCIIIILYCIFPDFIINCVNFSQSNCLGCKIKTQNKSLQARVAQLESDLDLQRENEDKNHSALNDETSRASKLAADLKAANDALTKREQVLYSSDISIV